MLYPQSFTYIPSSTSLNPSSIQPIQDVFPPPLFLLICASLCISTTAMVFGALILNISPMLWVFPPVFGLTILYHAVIIIISSTESAASLRLFSRPSVIIAFVLDGLWMAVSGITLAVNILVDMGKLDAPKGSWSAIIPCICAFVEVVIMASIAFFMQKERRRILYTDKWKWRSGQGASKSSQWSIAT